MAVNSRHWHRSLRSFTIFMKMFGSDLRKNVHSDFQMGGGRGKQQELLIYGLLSVIQDDQETHLGLFLVSPLQV